MKSLQGLFETPANDPALRRAKALVDSDRRLLDNLIGLRKKRGLTQDDVAKILGVKQPSVAAFERYDSDPKLSTIRRYAQAVAALVEHHTVLDNGQLDAGQWPPTCSEAWSTVPAKLVPTVAVTVEEHEQFRPVVRSIADVSRNDLALSA